MFQSTSHHAFSSLALLALLAPDVPAQCLPPVPQLFTVNDVRDLADYDLTDNCCDGDPLLPGQQCTLRAAIQNANLFGGNTTIVLGASTYALTLSGFEDAAVSGDLDIFSAGLARLEIRGVPGSTVIDATGIADRIFQVHTTVQATFELSLADLTLRGGGGGSPLLGAGIRQERGDLVLIDATLSDNHGNSQGGAIYFAGTGTLDVSGGVIRDNTADEGAGVYLASPAASVFTGTVFDSNGAGNYGGGLRVAAGASAALTNAGFLANGASDGGAVSTSGVTSLDGCLVNGNVAVWTGGGVQAVFGAGLSIFGSHLAGNTAGTGGGLWTDNGAIVFDTTIEQNQAARGGGIAHGSGALTLRRCTVANNSASDANFGGGGIYAGGQLLITNTTISGNVAPNGNGGGLYLVGGALHEIAATTIAFNGSPLGTGGGIRSAGSTSITFASTVLSDNSASSGAQNYSDPLGTGFVGSVGGNFDSDGTCGFTHPLDRSGTTIYPVVACLGPLQWNGGSTSTHALLPGSPAIDRGVCHDVAGNAIAQDQRAVLRTSPCDAGAYEAPAGTEPGTPFCFGVGCPCGNDDPTAGCFNSTGVGAELSGSGSTSVFFDDLVLTTTGCPPNNTGLYFVGAATFPAVNVGDGLACTGGVFRYFPGVVSAGGVFVLTNPVANAFPGAIVPGFTLHFQSWTRDVLCGPPPAPCPSPCGNNSSLSNAYTVTFKP